VTIPAGRADASQQEEFIVEMDENPYDPPRAPIGTRKQFRQFEIAGKGRRFGTFIIDQLVSFVLVVIVDIVIGVFIGIMGAADRVNDFSPLIFVINIMASLSYYAIFEGLFARTLGKLICGTKVIDEHGGPASFGQILMRTACRCIPFEPFSFVGERGWHDSIPKTSVVLA
jgi:uncharacterized RDD family membrane protein YckC